MTRLRHVKNSNSEFAINEPSRAIFQKSDRLVSGACLRPQVPVLWFIRLTQKRVFTLLSYCNSYLMKFIPFLTFSWRWFDKWRFKVYEKWCNNQLGADRVSDLSSECGSIEFLIEIIFASSKFSPLSSLPPSYPFHYQSILLLIHS